MFATDFETRASHLDFLRRLDSEISKPILPSDEMLEYIPTQAFVEYLAALCDPPFDGLIFSSAQTGVERKNIVVFPHATRLQIPQNFREELIFAESISEDSYLLFEGDESDIADGGHLNFSKHKLESSEAFFDDPVVRFVDDSIEIHTVHAIEHHVHTQGFSILKKSNDHFDF